MVLASLADKYQYIFFQKDVNVYWKYIVSRTERYQLIPGSSENRYVQILQKHIFRTIPQGRHGDDCAISIPYQLILDTIQRHTDLQTEVDLAGKGTTKQQLQDMLETGRRALEHKQEETRKRKRAQLE